jgi:hypothetical protein
MTKLETTSTITMPSTTMKRHEQTAANNHAHQPVNKGIDDGDNVIMSQKTKNPQAVPNK